MINKEELKELASVEMQLGLSKYPDICKIKTLKEFKDETKMMQWRKHHLIESEKMCKFILGIVLIISIFLANKFGFYGFIPFFINSIIAFIIFLKRKNIIKLIKYNLYHMAHVGIVSDKWIKEIESKGVLNHIEPKEILEKRGVKNYYINNDSVFDIKYFGK